MSILRVTFKSNFVWPEDKFAYGDETDTAAIIRADNLFHNVRGFMIKEGNLAIKVLEGKPEAVQFAVEFRSRFYGHARINILDSNFCRELYFDRWAFEFYEMQPEDKVILGLHGSRRGSIEDLPRERALKAVKFFAEKKAATLSHQPRL